MEATHKQPLPHQSRHTAPPDTPLQNTEDLARKVAEAKRRVAEAQMKLAVKDDPYVSVAQTGKKNHPVKLAQQGASSKMRTMQPQVRFNQGAHYSLTHVIETEDVPRPPPVSIFEVKANPCPSSSTAAKDVLLKAHQTSVMVTRSISIPKSSINSWPNTCDGQEAQLKAPKQPIAESPLKAGLDSEFGTLEKNIKVRIFPNSGMMGRSSRPTMTFTSGSRTSTSEPRIGQSRSPMEENKLEIVHVDQKVRLSGLMRVLTSDAVQDPTRSKRAYAEKSRCQNTRTKRIMRNIENQKSEQEKKGIVGAIFKVKTLTNPFRCFKNAEPLNLAGVCVFNPAFSMVYVGGASNIQNYKRPLDRGCASALRRGCSHRQCERRWYRTQRCCC
ncbi:hypothetical protein EDB19DRAFT_1830948 [Suillus lakei]|nr:hypothetical protein EDB19DRAFT_1830948 [Suillus lakei]